MTSAFTPPKRPSKYHLIRLPPPAVHHVAYMTGGLRQLYSHIRNSTSPPHAEFGKYTDRHGWFIPHVGMPLLARRYRYIRHLGKGQSSVFIKAQDTFCGDSLVAIKVLHTQYHVLGPQESDCIRRLNTADPDHIAATLRLKTSFTFDKHYCMVFELLRPDPLSLYFEELNKSEVLPCLRQVALHLLKAMGFLSQQNVIHADLKPENIVLKKEGDLSSLHVVDFGNAIHCVHEELSLYYDDFELQTLLYRAPEVLLGLPFGLEIDMWSFGCILAELYLQQPLFCAKDKQGVLDKMSELLGPLPEELYKKGKFYSEFCQLTTKTPPPISTITLMKKLDLNNYAFADFLAKILRYNPNERMSIHEAACHPFLAAEMGLAFLIPRSVNSIEGYPTVMLDKSSYTWKPSMSDEMRRLPIFKEQSVITESITPSRSQTGSPFDPSMNCAKYRLMQDEGPGTTRFSNNQKRLRLAVHNPMNSVPQSGPSKPLPQYHGLRPLISSTHLDVQHEPIEILAKEALEDDQLTCNSVKQGQLVKSETVIHVIKIEPKDDIKQEPNDHFVGFSIVHKSDRNRNGLAKVCSEAKQNSMYDSSEVPCTMKASKRNDRSLEHVTVPDAATDAASTILDRRKKKSMSQEEAVIINRNLSSQKKQSILQTELMTKDRSFTSSRSSDRGSYSSRDLCQEKRTNCPSVMKSDTASSERGSISITLDSAIDCEYENTEEESMHVLQLSSPQDLQNNNILTVINVSSSRKDHSPAVKPDSLLENYPPSSDDDSRSSDDGSDQSEGSEEGYSSGPSAYSNCQDSLEKVDSQKLQGKTPGKVNQHRQVKTPVKPGEMKSLEKSFQNDPQQIAESPNEKSHKYVSTKRKEAALCKIHVKKTKEDSDESEQVSKNFLRKKKKVPTATLR